MLISVLASSKLISILAKDMVQSEIAKNLVQNLLITSRRILQTNSMQNVESIKTTEAQLDRRNSGSTEYLVYNWLEGLFTWFQVIILWHEPYQSIFTISGLFSSFLLLTYIAPRFYATVLIAIFVYNFTKVWFEHVWPEIRVTPTPEAEQESILDVDRYSHLHPQLMNLSEFGSLISNLIKLGGQYVRKLAQLRSEKPVSFCLLICSLLSCTAFVGNIISGLNLILFIVTGLISAPGIYLYLLPAQVKQYLNETCTVKIFHKAIQESRDDYNNLSTQMDSSHKVISNITSALPPTTTTTTTTTTTSPSTATLITTHSKTLFDSLLSMAYQSHIRAAAAASQEKKEMEENNQEEEVEKEDDDEEDDQHDFVIL